MTLTNPASGRGRRIQSGVATSTAPLLTPRAMSITPQTTRPAAMIPGNHAGPNFCPGIAGYPWMCQRMTRPSAASAAPVTASLIFKLFRYSDRLHHGAEVGVGFRHELRGVLRSLPDHAEPARGHEFLVFLRV